MSRRSPTPPQRMVLRVISKDRQGAIHEIFEQSIPASADEVALFLRRYPAKATVAAAMLSGGSITIERKEAA